MAFENSSGVSIEDLTMSQVSKDFFFDGMVLPVTVYLKMKVDHYLILGNKGEKSKFSNFQSYKNAHSSVYVAILDLPILINYVTTMTEKAVQHKTLPDGLKARFMVGLASNALQCFDKKGFASLVELQRVSNMVLGLGKTVSNFNDILNILRDLKEEEAKYAMATSMVSVMLCEEMDVNLKGAVEKVALGALLIDIGLRYLPKALLERPRHLWSPADNALYETHPAKGVEMLRDLKDVSSDVLLIVAEHHENAIGTGFPKRVRDLKISPLSRIVIVASYYTSLIFNSRSEGVAYDSDQAISYMNDILGQPFNKQVFLGLKNIINRAHLQKKMGQAV
ncbi:MAG: HD domain-containing protein [Bdellovibrionales bacterium]|nr:HD domain-containing protein [Bdellovibrionales bacterium]